MRVEVRLFATFRRDREKKSFMELPAGSLVEDVVYKLKIDKDEVAILLVNGRDGEMSRELKDGDVISLFPPVGGG